MVDVEIGEDDDEESYYMQTSLAKAIKLQQLVHAADNTGFMQALRRRISQSLYLERRSYMLPSSR